MATRYIPGLNRKEDVVSEPEVSQASIPKDVPQELIDGFKNGTKQVRKITLNTW